MRARLLLAALALTACRSAPPTKPGFSWSPDVRPAAYFPLADGSAWSYEVADAATGEKILAINRGLRHEGTPAGFGQAPAALSYEDRGDELVRLPSGTPVLKAPIRKDASWPIPGGE